MAFSSDALEVICKHLDVCSLLQLAATDSKTRSRLAACALHVHDPIVWMATPTAVLQQLVCHQRVLHKPCEVLCVAWCPQSRRIVCGLDNNKVFMVDTDKPDQLLGFDNHDDAVLSVAWSPNGDEFLSAGEDNNICIRDPSTGSTKRVLRGQNVPTPTYRFVWSAKWSPNGTKLVTACNSRIVQIVDVTTGHIDHHLTGHTNDVITVDWSPQGDKVVSGSSDYTARIWDVATDQTLHVLDCKAGLWSVAWSPDGTRIASTSSGLCAHIWDATTGQALHELHGHTESAMSVAWSPDSTKVVTGSFDHTLRIWDTTTGQVLRILRGHLDIVSSVAWSPDGTSIVSGSYDYTIRVWKVLV